MIHIAICDDEREALYMIQREVTKAAAHQNIPVETLIYTDGRKAVDYICSHEDEVDILLLDIDMPGISGLEAAEQIRQVNEDIILIFVSAHEQYVFESLEYAPFRYLRKNRIHEELEPALQAACKSISRESSKSLEMKTKDGEIKIRHSDIMYFEMLLRKVHIHTKDGMDRELASRITIKMLCEEMEDENFIQIHSGCVVNVKYVSEYSGHLLTLTNGIELVVSRGRMKEVKEAILRYWREKV